MIPGPTWARAGRHCRVLRLGAVTIGLTAPIPRRRPGGGLRRLGRWRVRPLNQDTLDRLAAEGLVVRRV